MDGIVQDAPTLVPSLGVFGLLGWLIIHLMRQASKDRADYSETVDKLRAAHSSEIVQMQARHETQIENLKEQIKELKDEISELRASLDENRRELWAAQDLNAQYRRQIEALSGGST